MNISTVFIYNGVVVEYEHVTDETTTTEEEEARRTFDTNAPRDRSWSVVRGRNTMQIRNLFNKEDRAVSPVIGVILMVAITVILAAVIGTFVLGLGNNVQQNAQAGVTFSQQGIDGASDEATVLVTVNSIQRADSFTVKISGESDTDAEISESATLGEATSLSVGDTLTVANADTGSKITVIASYDGNDNVIGEYTVK